MDSAAKNNNSNNWRNELSQDSRQKIVDEIMDTLQRHMPFTGPDGMNELRKIGLRFEEKMYAAAGDQQDYLCKISLKIQSLRNHVPRDANHLALVSSSSNQKPLDPGLMMPSHSLASENGNGISLLGQSQPQQALLQQNLKSGIRAGGMQNSVGLPSSLPSMQNLSQSTSGNVFGTQSALNNSTGQVLPQNALLPSVQRQMQFRQQQVAQQHQQPQDQLLYQEPLQHQQQHLQHPQQQVILKENLQQSQLAPSILQQQQQPVMQQSQLQASQQSILQSAQAPTFQTSQQSLICQFQPSVLQPAQQSNLQQTSESFLQQHQQSVLRQQQSVLKQQPPICQQQQPSIFNVPNMQTQQQQHLQQIIQSKHSQYQQAQQPSPSLLQPQSQQLQQQPQHEQLVSQLQHQPQQLQPQQPLLPQLNSVQQDLQQRLHMPGGLLQQQQHQNSVEQQKQLLQAQNQRLSDVPTSQTGQSNVIDWQEKIYQKLQKLKDIYFPDLIELVQRLTVKCQQPMAADQLEKLKVFKDKIQCMMQYFQVSKNNIPPGFPEDKIDVVEKQIQFVLNSCKPEKPVLQQQQGQQQPLLPQSNSVQQEPQQRLHMPGGLLQQQQQQQNSVEQQKQFLQAQNQRLLDAPTTSMESSCQTRQSNVIEWQEKIYQKLQKLKDTYFPDLRELLQRLTVKSQQPMAADQLEKLKVFKGKIQRMMQYFQVSKNNIPPGFPEDKIDFVEKQIQYVLSSFKPGKSALQQQQGHQQFLPQSSSHLPSMQQQSQSTSFYRSPNNSTEWINSKDMPFTGPDGMNELRKIVLPLEEKIYAAAVDQQDYLRKISLKALSLRNHVSRDGNPLAGAFSSSN